ncbi:DUF3868 domain-containing protein [uncultured Dysgonomonas sp.]|uniref:DUF3868 domain-containing protein n=1 Tax=uncultured Dysgonomonas sp. TaxID=206096 RepID=A0A212JAS1_9BACT|nr:DUF3868 domain-containing protein [uncultured Dysgonomonas sp.]SBV96511.1 conserved exported hypothetical protein [uncultured Dysgonomonas sp.]
MEKKYLYMLVLLLIASVTTAQTEYGKQITVHEVAEKRDNRLYINLELILDKLQLKSEHMLILSPVIESASKDITKKLAPIVVSGNNRYKSLSRTLALKDKHIFETKPDTVVRRNNGEPQKITYNMSTPFEKWMEKGTLTLQEEVQGCAFCDLNKVERLLISSITENPLEPIYQTNYVEPKAEPIKNRKEVIELYLSHKADCSIIHPDFENNSSELEKFTSIFRKVVNSDDFSFTGINITGYASPEGTYQYNKELSEARTKSLIEYLRKNYILDENLFTLDWKGEDWDGLVKILETYQIENKDKILDIIRTVDVHQGREGQIMKINSGTIYNTLLKEIFPQLRRNVCTVEYTVSPFDINKAQQIIKTNPKALSIEEMYLVANTFPKGSEAYNEIFIIAASTFPDNVEAVTNAAAINISRGNITKASQMLEKVKHHPTAWNNMGIVKSLQTKYNEAKEYFIKAANNGVKQSANNLVQLNEFLEH